jgi:hypothetical protein
MADHLHNFNSFTLNTLGKYNEKKLTKLFWIIFLCSLDLWKNHTPLTWYENKNLGTRLVLGPSPEHCGFSVSSRCRLNHKDTAHRSYRSVHTFTIPITERFLSSLGNSVCRQKRNVLLHRNVTWYILSVARACNLLNQTYILTKNVKFSTKPTYKTKSPQFTTNSQIPNTNQMSTNYSLFLCITVPADQLVYQISPQNWMGLLCSEEPLFTDLLINSQFEGRKVAYNTNFHTFNYSSHCYQ